MSEKEENVVKGNRKLEEDVKSDVSSDITQCDTDNNEASIVLRQIVLSTAQYPKRKSPIVEVSPTDKQEDDTNSVTTTTSDVNSDDDAASIVSRISQIVVEQEEKLMSPLDWLADNKNKIGSCYLNQKNGTVCRPIGFNSTVSNISKHNNKLRPKKKRDKSLINQQTRGRSGSLVQGQQNPDHEQAKHESSIGKVHVRVGSANDTSITYHTEDPTSCSLPDELNLPIEQNPNKIQISDSVENVVDQDKTDHHISKEVSETKSISLLKLEMDDYEPSFVRKNESSSFSPERGNLRRMESSQCQKQTFAKEMAANKDGDKSLKPRSYRAGSMNLDKNSQLMLNIKRSAWTLSEFDQTFNKSGDSNSNKSESNSSNDIDKFVLNSCEPANQMKQGSGLEKQSSNLLIRASKNAINLSPTQAIVNDGRFNNEFFNGRRLSHAHSIASVSSSLDSFYIDPGKSIEKGGPSINSKKHAIGSSSGGGGDQDDKMSCIKSYFNMSKFGQYVPILEWLPSYKINFFWGDLMAGMAVAVLNISTSLSAAVIADTDLSVAFRASIVNTFIYAILCSSKHTSFGSWSIMSQMLHVSVKRALSDELLLARLNLGPSASWDPDEYERWHLNIIIMYTFLIGLVQLICGLLNLGNILASFIPEALCSSLIAATAFTMAIGQLANMCGTSNKILYSIDRNTTVLWADLKNPPLDITDLFSGLFRWIKQIALLIKYNEQINLACVLISVGSVILLFLNQYIVQKQLEKLFKRKIFIPSEMILLIVMIIISYSLSLNENYRVTTCGPIHISFVIPNLPDLRLVRELWFESLASALISYTMVYIMAKTYSNKLNYEVDCNQELIACGAGNLVGGLFNALPATASFSRTAGQVEAGGQTQMASIINCIVLVILAQLLGHHVAMLPVCVMSATLFYGFVRMMTRFSEVFIYWRVCKVDFAIWMVTFVAILTSDIVNGFVYGFIFSIFTMLYRAQNRRCYMLGSIGTSDVYVPIVKYPLAKEIDGIKIFQFCGPIHYVCADLFERLLRQKTHVNVKQIVRHITEQEVVKFNPRDLNLPTHIILDFSMISYIDSAGIHVIKKIIEDYKRVNMTIFLASLASHVAAVIKNEPSLWNVYKDVFYVTLADAVHCAAIDSRQQQNHHNSALEIVAVDNQGK